MGMTCTLRRVPEAELERLLALTPEEFSSQLHEEDERALAASGLEERPVRPKNFLLRLLLRLSPITVSEVVRRPDAPPPPPDEELRLPEDMADLEGVWHGLHFLFTGTAWEGEAPASFLVAGGQDLGDDDDEHVRALRPEEVRRFAAFLESLSREELTRRYDPSRMAQLRVSDPSLEHLLGGFEDLRAFVAEAVGNGQGLIVRLG